MANKEKIGKEFPAFTWEVEKGKIRELVQAIGDNNPIFLEREAAIAAGYKDIVAPATFVTVPMMWTNSLTSTLDDADVKFVNILHGEEEYEYFAEIYPGDILTGQAKITDIQTKKGKSGEMDLVKIEVNYINQEGKPVLKARTLIVERI